MNKEQIKFLILLIGTYLVVYGFCQFWIGVCAPGGLYWPFADQYLNFIKWYRELLIWLAVKIADIFDLQTLSNSTQMRIIGKGGVNIVYSCVGYGILSALTAIGIAIPKKSVKQKVYFILIGFFVFTVLNSLRIFLIAYYMKEAKKLSVDHHDLFNYFCYVLLMLGVYWWSRRRTRA
ncbi:exosortase/archaeosortase family protein [Pseudopedobacter beijingensis]|uniref:Exosortase/archaeosortase family protein n=1 Tax=Pseudopedobacter beijingensis TaxID=1207056 RepID=A0ABW4I8G1_9SPHI